MDLSLLDSGVTPDISNEKAISLRSFNLFTLVAIVVVLVGALAWFLDAGIPEMAVLMFVFDFAFVACYFVNMMNRPDTARFALLVSSGASFTTVSICTDFATSFHYGFILSAVFPFLVFTRKEIVKIAISLVIVVGFVIVTIVGHTFVGPLIDLPPEVVKRMNVSNLISLIVLVGSIIIYYVFKVQVDLEKERQRSQDLLSRTLPSQIADRLMKSESVIADSHDEATIMFADLVGFSQLSSRVTASHLVEVLNEMFSEFDALARRYEVEKIKTIGDCYMVAGGVIQKGRAQCVSVASMALDILNVVDSTSKKLDYPLEVRIGVHLGPVVSGVIGNERYTFDLWGETVNIASRLESSGIPGRVHVSELVYWRLKKSFEFEERGKIELKGQEGVFSTYFLTKPRETDQADNVIEFEPGSSVAH